MTHQEPFCFNFLPCVGEGALTFKIYRPVGCSHQASQKAAFYLNHVMHNILFKKIKIHYSSDWQLVTPIPSLVSYENRLLTRPEVFGLNYSCYNYSLQPRPDPKKYQTEESSRTHFHGLRGQRNLCSNNEAMILNYGSIYRTRLVSGLSCWLP